MRILSLDKGHSVICTHLMIVTRSGSVTTRVSGDESAASPWIPLVFPSVVMNSQPGSSPTMTVGVRTNEFAATIWSQARSETPRDKNWLDIGERQPAAMFAIAAAVSTRASNDLCGSCFRQQLRRG
jgi:hypothetical protein